MPDDLRAYVAQQRRWRHPRTGAQGRVWRRRALAASSVQPDWSSWRIVSLVVMLGLCCLVWLLPPAAPPAAPPITGDWTLLPGQQGRFVYDAAAQRWRLVEPASPVPPVTDIAPCIMDTTAQGVAGRWVTASQTTAGACHVGEVYGVAEFAIGEMVDDVTQQGQPARIAMFHEGDALRVVGTTDQPMTNKRLSPSSTAVMHGVVLVTYGSHGIALLNGSDVAQRCETVGGGDTYLLPPYGGERRQSPYALPLFCVPDQR